ncbi:MAG: decaprenyl-phosphate phosphoribosyltransferase [Syntrophobacteraceae bacterium]|nr:decaprenyl-phosphate phosphoribosyltransferase [Desulfobacteraceae bacterium]
MNSPHPLKSLNRSRPVSTGGGIAACVQLARPHQYVKNTFILLPLFFGYKLTDLHALAVTLWAFVAFSLAASAVYVLNDIRDVNEDREHPHKRNRPVASGAINTSQAVLLLLLLLAASLLVSLAFLPTAFLYILAVYLLLNAGYSFHLKHIAIVDVVCIAMGFVLRVIAGGIVSEVPVSHWIIIMTFLLAIFLALGKRRDDLLLSANGCSPRKSLHGYNLEFVSLSMVVMSSVVIVAYLLYCVSPEIIQKHGTHDLYFTGFWVVVGFLRYLQITLVEGRSGSPTLILLQDYFLWTVIGGWILTFYWLIYVAHC